MLRNKDFKYNHMTPVAAEIAKSFETENDNWTVDFMPCIDCDSGWWLVAKYTTDDISKTFLISENPFFYHVDIGKFFNVVKTVTEPVQNEIFDIQIFSNSQKEMIFSGLQRNFNLNEIITNKYEEIGDRAYKFKNNEQIDVYDVFMSDKQNKYPTLTIS